MGVDCEGCGTSMLDLLLPKIRRDVHTVLLEADYPRMGTGANGRGYNPGGSEVSMDYKKFKEFLIKIGFCIVEQFNDCDRKSYQVPNIRSEWCGKEIEHYAFRRPCPL